MHERYAVFSYRTEPPTRKHDQDNLFGNAVNLVYCWSPVTLFTFQPGKILIFFGKSRSLCDAQRQESQKVRETERAKEVEGPVVLMFF